MGKNTVDKIQESQWEVLNIELSEYEILLMIVCAVEAAVRTSFTKYLHSFGDRVYK